LKNGTIDLKEAYEEYHKTYQEKEKVQNVKFSLVYSFEDENCPNLQKVYINYP
jgi:hypothetical protein